MIGARDWLLGWGVVSLRKASCEIICVGTEILLGDIVNTNAQYIAKGLARLGIDVYYQTVVGDNPKRLASALEIARSRADIIITTGGLGPTYDDLTKETVAASFGRKLVMDEKCLEELAFFFTRLGREMTENNKKQAMMPEGSIILDNPQGTAPGCLIEGDDGKVAIMMPGPPREMKPMFDNLVAPYLRKYSEYILFSSVLRVIGIGESAMETRVLDIMERMTNPTVAPYAKSGECILRVTAKAKDEKEAEALMAPVIEEIRRRLGDHVYGVDIDSLQQHIAQLLEEQRKTIAFAEVCTGGIAAERLFEATTRPETLKLSMSSCSIEGMEGMLEGSDAASHALDTIGQKAVALAKAVAAFSGADLGVGIIKKSETIYYSVSYGQREDTESYNYPPGRDQEYVNTLAANRAFDMIRKMLRRESPKHLQCKPDIADKVTILPS